MRGIIERFREPGFVLDIVQILVFFVAALLISLDMLGIWVQVPWLRQNLVNFTFIAICVLIISTVLERRIKLEGIERNTGSKLDQVIQYFENSIPEGIRLMDEYPSTLDVLLAESTEVCFLGMSLVGLVSQHTGFFIDKASRGCIFKFLLTDPESPAVEVIPSLSTTRTTDFRRKDIRASIERLSPTVETGNAEIRLTKYVPPFSLIVSDPYSHRGRVQICLFSYNISPNERPYFVITRSMDLKWYDFFINQFNMLWQDANKVVIDSNSSPST